MAPPRCLLPLLLSLLLVPGCNTTRDGVDLARADLGSGNARLAATRAQQALDSHELSAEERVSAHLVAARAQLAMGEFTRAATHFRAASTPAASPAQRADIARGLGDVRYRQRDFAGAREQYALTLQQSLGQAEEREVHYRMAVCLRHLGREAEASAHLAQASGYQPAARDPLRYESARPAVASWASARQSSPPSTFASNSRSSSNWRPPVSTPVTVTYRGNSGAPTILPRSRWKARSSRRNYAPMGRIKRITVHHAGDRFSSGSEAEAAKQILGIQRYHQNGRGWADIGYHLIIDPSGRVWEGRPLDKQGAHAGSSEANAGNVGIMLLGHFGEQEPSEAQVRSLTDVVSWLRARHGLDGKAIATHDEIRKAFTGSGTECPGRNLATVVRELRASGGVTLSGGSAPRGGSARYQVQKGDTLYAIARQHHVSPAALKAANPGVDPDHLLAGAFLRVP